MKHYLRKPLVALLLALLLALPLAAQVIRSGTTSSGGFVQQKLISSSPIVLFSLQGYHQGGSARYIQIHQVASLSGGEVPTHSHKIPATDNFYLIIPVSGMPLTKCLIAVSTTADTYTAGAADVIFSTTANGL